MEMIDTFVQCSDVDRMTGMRDGMIGCARGMLEHLRDEAVGMDPILDELDMLEVELRILGVRG